MDDTARVRSSWGNKETWPRDGYYNMDLGSGVCGESVEVFVNGYGICRRSIPRDGNARVDFVLKGASATPAR
ncbi:MAG: hypothetical protein LBF38_05560 [Deltaproteobacteria bacterium]|nr:hypothetical protein [Deltaproteobacteria bacterium]